MDIYTCIHVHVYQINTHMWHMATNISYTCILYVILILASNDHTKSHDPQNTNVTMVVNRWYNFVWCPCIKIDPEPSLPANGTPHIHVEQDDTHSNYKNTNFDRLYSVSTTDAVSQGKEGN